MPRCHASRRVQVGRSQFPDIPSGLNYVATSGAGQVADAQGSRTRRPGGGKNSSRMRAGWGDAHRLGCPRVRVGRADGSYGRGGAAPVWPQHLTPVLSAVGWATSYRYTRPCRPCAKTVRNPGLGGVRPRGWPGQGSVSAKGLGPDRHTLPVCGCSLRAPDGGGAPGTSIPSLLPECYRQLAPDLFQGPAGRSGELAFPRASPLRYTAPALLVTYARTHARRRFSSQPGSQGPSARRPVAIMKRDGTVVGASAPARAQRRS